MNLEGDIWCDARNGEMLRYAAQGEAAKVSSFGRVQSTVGIIGSGCPALSGHMYAGIGRKVCPGHRLVLRAFHRSPAHDELLHHKGRTTTNTHIEQSLKRECLVCYTDGESKAFLRFWKVYWKHGSVQADRRTNIRNFNMDAVRFTEVCSAEVESVLSEVSAC